MNPALEILVGARKLVKERFAHGSLQTFDGHHCALGAVNQVAHIEQKYHRPLRKGTPAERAIFFLENAATGLIPSEFKNSVPASCDFTIVEINDQIGKNAVLKVFDRAISNCKRRHVSKTPIKLR